MRSVFLVSCLLLVSSLVLRADSRDATCERVFNRLKTAKGLLISQAPYLRVVAQLPNPDLSIAMAVEDSIFLDRETFQVCREMGADSLNALAFILSHELAHYIKGHTEEHEYEKEIEIMANVAIMDAVEVDDRRAKRKVKSIMRQFGIRNAEIEADLEAGFISHLSGYCALEAGPEMLERSYTRFGLKREAGNYPSLEERKEMIREVGRVLDSLLYVFDAANLASVVGIHREAKASYEVITDHFVSTKLLNNLAVTELRRFMDFHWGPNDIIYELPITMSLPEFVDHEHDAVPVLTEEGLRLERIRYLETVAQLDQMIAKLKKAQSLNPQYYPAHLNESIAYYIRYLTASNFLWSPDYVHDDLEYAEVSALRAKQVLLDEPITNDKALCDVFNMLAIIDHVKGDSSSAAQQLLLAEERVEKSINTHINRLVIQGNWEARQDFYLSFERTEQRRLEAIPLIDEDRAKSLQDLQVATSSYQGTLLKDMITDASLELREERVLIKSLPGSSNLVERQLRLGIADTEEYRLYRFAEYEGLSKIDIGSIFIVPKDLSEPLIEGLVRGMNFSSLTELIGKPLDRVQAPNASLILYPGVIFEFVAGKLSSWVIYEDLDPFDRR